MKKNIAELEVENITLKKNLDQINLNSLISNSDTEILQSEITFLKKKLNEINLEN